MTDFIDKPVQAYKEKFKKEVKKRALDHFNELVKKAKVDEKKNEETINELNGILDEKRKKKRWHSFFIVIGIIFTIATVALGLMSYFKQEIMVYTIIGGCVALGLAIFSYVKVGQLGKKIRLLDFKKETLVEEANKQLEELDELLNEKWPHRIFNEVLQNVKLNDYFSRKEHMNFFYIYNLQSELKENETALRVLSGNIGENPFVFLLKREQVFEDVSYNGHLDIRWTTIEYDSNGNREIVEHKQRLTATTYHPAPFFYDETLLYFGCEAGDELNFSREISGINKMSEKKIKEKVSKEMKRLRKKAEKSMGKKNAFVPMANDEFEALFCAEDRDNDVQFRMLFTPLAQQNMVEQLKCKELYGDDFSFQKMRRLNLIRNYHLQGEDFTWGTNNYYSYDLKEFRQGFVDFVLYFFKKTYGALLPLLNIPAYQQTASGEDWKKNEELVKDIKESERSIFEAESMANVFGDWYYPKKSKTLSIVKAKELGDNNFQIESYGFDTIEHVEYVEKRGDDGYTHQVPVQWTEYIKVTSTNEMNEDEVTL